LGHAARRWYLVHETAKEWLADHRTGRGRSSVVRCGWRQVETAVGTVPVVVLEVFLEHYL
jgi:hypothetical protein